MATDVMNYFKSYDVTLFLNSLNTSKPFKLFEEIVSIIIF